MSDGQPARRGRSRPGRAVAALTSVLLLATGPGAACSGDDDVELSSEEFCERLVAVADFDDRLGRLETLELTETRDELRQLAEGAPSGIEPSMRELVDYVDAVVDALEDVESGDEAGAQEALRALDAGSAAEVEAAGLEVERFSRERCGLDLRTGATVPPGTTVPPETTIPPETDEVSGSRPA